MKTKHKLLVLFILAIAIAAGACREERPVDAVDLPRHAKGFLREHFYGVPVVSVEREWLIGDYEVLLGDGTRLEFTVLGNLEYAEAPCGDKLPTTVKRLLPRKARAWLDANYPGDSIHSMASEGRHWRIEICHKDPGLIFDHKGRFVRTDQ